jgi:hypothetical protein
MDDDLERRLRLGRRIVKEMTDRRPPWSFDEIYKRSGELDPKGKGIAKPTLERWISGEPVGRERRLYLLCDLFEWDHESPDRIRDGGEPVYVERPGPDGEIIAQVDRLATAIEEAAAAIRRMLPRAGG